ncbi:MAG: hypothetical protein FJZ60_00070 [Chlamydiae bacterium]|nr:hypothetical protein [Chlamydiota bacterium]
MSADRDLLKQYIKESLQEDFWNDDEDDEDRRFRPHSKKKSWLSRLVQSIPDVLGIERKKSSKTVARSTSQVRRRARRVFDEWFEEVEGHTDPADLDDLLDMKRDVFSTSLRVYSSALKKRNSESEASRSMINFLEDNYEKIF